MIGNSSAFLDVLRLIARYARFDVPVLIFGETGTGKELAARAIHYQGARRNGPFVPVNCGAIPDTLIENELFGHDRGAFTDARSQRKGLIGYAQGGTLFLDEIDALTPRAQVALLRFLQDGSYRPLGGSRVESSDVRIIAASNADLAALTGSGAFRLDLFYRLRIAELAMPPLRERHGDVEILARHFTRSYAAQFAQPEKSVHADTLEWFDRYNWPGNVRELENMICREFLLADDVVMRITAPASCAPRGEGDPLRLRFASGKARAVEEFEKRYLTSLLARANGNVTSAAVIAGKERRALGKLLKKHGIDPRHFAPGA